MCGAKRSPSAVALCFVAGYLRLTFGDHARGCYARVQTGCPQRRAGLVRNQCSIFRLRLLTAEKQRARAISIIEGLFPTDSEYVGTNSIGKRLLQQAKDELNNWRNEPTNILIRYAQLCEQEENRSVRNIIKPYHKSIKVYKEVIHV